LIGDDEQLLEQIRGFRDDGSVRGFVVSINSPGGVVGPSQSVYHELRRLRDDEDRPVIASIGGIGTSGGYYVALGADSIFAMPGSLTGSIGVVMEFPNATELMDKVGVRMEVVKSAEHKDIGSPFREMTEADRALLDSLVRDVYDQFVDVVALERRIQADEVRRVADGRVMSGQQALEFGLIDRIGNLHDALAAAGRMAGLGENPQVVKPHERPFRMLDLLLGRAVTRVLDSAIAPITESATPRLKFVVPW
jgi:protease-4